MPPPQNNDASEAFGKLPNDSESFGNVPNLSERKVNHVLTVHAVARMFEDAGVARTERSITNWCKRDNNGVSRLDCYLDPNEGKFFITPQSVERAIEEEKSKIISGELPHVSETFGNVPNVSEAFRSRECFVSERFGSVRDTSHWHGLFFCHSMIKFFLIAI